MRRLFTELMLFALCGIYFSAHSNVINVTTQDDFGKLIHNEHLVCVKFFAPWCGACNTIKDQFTELSKNNELQHVQFAEVDIDALPTVAHEYNVEYIPQLILFKNGKHIKTLSLNSQNTIKEEILQHENYTHEKHEKKSKDKSPRRQKNLLTIIMEIIYAIIQYMKQSLVWLKHNISTTFSG